MASVLMACGDLEPSAVPFAQASITVVNLTADTIAFEAWERELSHRLDINPRAPAASFGERVAAPGDSRRLATSQISGYAPGATVRFFVYRVSGGEGVYRGGLDVTYAELATLAWRVVISESTLTGPNLDFGHLSGASS